jgi:Zn-dependent protease
MEFETIIYKAAVWALPVLFAITLHEVAHGYVADKLGDSTSRMLGRLTLNPVKHIDPIGTVLVPLVMLLVGGFIFGWAKPIPVNTRNLKNPRKDMAWVAVAGPLANLAMAIGWGFFILLSHIAPNPGIQQGLQDMAVAGVLINILLMVLNLIPLPPLDGGRVLSGFVPRNIANMLDKIEPYGFFIVLALFLSGIFSSVFGPIIQTLVYIILSIFT